MFSQLFKVTCLFFVLTLSACLAPNIAFTQNAYGMRAGLNLSTFRLSEDDDTINPFKFDYVWGTHLGGHARFGLSRLFSLQTELQYTRLGGKWLAEDSPTEELTLTFRHHWFQGLVLARMDIPFHEFKFHILAGPHFGYGVGKVLHEVEFVFKAGEDRFTTKEKGKISWEETGESLRRFEPGITVGFGADYPLGPGRIGVDLRFQRGFSSLINPEDGLVYFSNMNFQFGLSYSLLFSRVEQ
jgi:hypothetical protein